MNNIESLQIIPGPCAAESKSQMLLSAQEAQKRGIEKIRLSLWKPRTEPGFDGIGEVGIPVLLEVAQMGLIPATEVMIPSHAEKILSGVLAKDSNTHVLLWLGSRNQNNILQKDIGSIIAGEDRVKLMIKNQMWKDKNHWIGIVKHVLAGGAKPEQLMLCHRGFQPSTDDLRNPPDMDLALLVQDELFKLLGFMIPLIGDPSHAAGGSPENVMSMALRMARHRTIINDIPRAINGLIVEVHLNPSIAQTDKKQQLRWSEFDLLLDQLREKETV